MVGTLLFDFLNLQVKGHWDTCTVTTLSQAQANLITDFHQHISLHVRTPTIYVI